jgi:hypothetical protein
MRLKFLSLVFLGAITTSVTMSDELKETTSASKTKGETRKDPVEEFRAELTAFLLNAAPDLKNDERSRIKKAKAVNAVRKEIWEIIDKHAAKLRPAEGVKKYVSRDRDFVLVIAANPDGINSAEPKLAEIRDDQARLVVAIGGDGCPGRFGTNGGTGGPGIAKAPKGVAVALGGRGGDAKFANQAGQGMAGGGGGGSIAEGGIGSIALGGPGGNGFQGSGGGGGGGGSGGGAGIINPEAIRDAMEDKVALETFRAEVTALLANLPADFKDDESAHAKKEEVTNALRQKLSQLVENYSPRLRPRFGAKKYVSKDKDFVLVIAANADGLSIAEPEPAEAIEPQAHLVIAIGGDGSPGPMNGNGESGGTAIAESDKGVALAMGGRGGDPMFPGKGGGGTAGGPGGPADARGGIGSIGLGGPGGKGFRFKPGLGVNGVDGIGGGGGIINYAAIREVMRKN